MHLTIRPATASRFGVPSAAAVVAVFALLLIAPATSAATTISTVSSWTNQKIESFGDPNTATYGQVVTAPAGQNSLESFTFYLHVPTGLAFRPYVYAWSGEKATGPDLYEGPDLHTGEYVTGVYSPVTATTGGVPVSPGEKYVIFFSVSKDKAVDEGTHQGGEWAWVASSAYGGGSTVWMNNGYKPEEWTVPGELEVFPGEFIPNSWERETAHDMEFSAVFGVSPTVSSVAPSSVSEGTQLTVAGTNFSGATQVLFGGTPASSFTIDGDGQITAVVPGGLSGTVDVTVITAAGSSATSAADRVTVSVPSTPSVSSANTTASGSITTSAAHCIAPSMRGLGIEAVEQVLRARDCRLGTVALHYSHLAKGQLVEQSLHQGTIMPAGTAVNVWLSRGAHKRHKRHSARSSRAMGRSHH